VGRTSRIYHQQRPDRDGRALTLVRGPQPWSEEPQTVTGRPASPASIARRLSCLSRFYDYGIKDAELLEHSPGANVRRPKVSDDSATVGLTAEELDRLLTAAEAHGRCRRRS
jgi:site-specific recombinase XerD